MLRKIAIVIFIFLLPSYCLAGYVMGRTASSAVNSFGTYYFDDGALATDNSGKGQNLSPNNSPTQETSIQQQGDGCVHYVGASSEWHSITDSNLYPGHPLKANTGEHDFTIAFWFRIASTPADQISYIFSKYDSEDGYRQYAIIIDDSSGNETGNANSLYILHGLNTTYDEIFYGDVPALSYDIWYFIGATYNASTNTHRALLWDDNAGDWVSGSPYSEQAINNLYMSSLANLVIANRHDGDANRQFDGYVDNLRIYDSILSDSEIIEIKNEN